MKFQTNAVVVLYAGINSWWKPRNLMARANQQPSGKIQIHQKDASGENRVEFLRKNGNAGRNHQLQHHGNTIDQPDVGVLSDLEASHHRSLSAECTAGFVQCFDGYTSENVPCYEECNGNCCVGTASFPDACQGFTGSVCMDNSCQGRDACAGANLGQIVNSCKGDDACREAGSSGGSVGPILDSCNDDRACQYAGRQYGTVSSISASCNGRYACSEAADFYGVIGDIQGSCNANFACSNMADNNGRVGTYLFEGSCNYLSSCGDLGYNGGDFDTLGNCCNNGIGECGGNDGLPAECTPPMPSLAPSSSPSVSSAPSTSSSPSALALDRLIYETVSDIFSDIQLVQSDINDIEADVDLLPGINANVSAVLDSSARVENGVSTLATAVGEIDSDIEEIKVFVSSNTTSNTDLVHEIESIVDNALAAHTSVALDAEVSVLSRNGQTKSILLLVTADGAATNADVEPRLSTFDASNGAEIDVTVSISNISAGKYVVNFSNNGSVFWLTVTFAGSERTLMFEI